MVCNRLGNQHSHGGMREHIWPFNKNENPHSDNERRQSRKPHKLWRKSLRAQFAFVNHLSTFHISQETNVQRKHWLTNIWVLDNSSHTIEYHIFDRFARNFHQLKDDLRRSRILVGKCVRLRPLGQGHSPCICIRIRISTFTSAMHMRMQGSAPLNLTFLKYGWEKILGGAELPAFPWFMQGACFELKTNTFKKNI